MDLRKLEGENEFQYIWRIGQLKDNKLIDMEWEELGNLFNKELREEDEEFTSSAYRKPYQQAVKYYENVFKFMLNNNDFIEDIDLKKQELQKERYKIQATKLELNRVLRQDSRFDLFYENIKNSIVSLEPPVFNILEYQDTEKEYILGCGDLHYGANFKSENNEYSREICKQRFEKLLSVLAYEINKNKISKIKMINVADSIQGMLRYTDLQINDIAVVDCVVEISRLIAEFLNKLSTYCIVEYYHCPAANHAQTRPLGSKASEIATEDMERIIVNYISDLVIKNDRVKVFTNLNKEYVELDIFNFKAIVLHGHQIKNVPTVIKDLSNLHRKFYDYAFLGHRHSANEIIVGEGLKHNIEILTCPSFVGSDPYADTLHVGSKAMCKLYEFDINNGHTGSKNIILN